MWSDAAERGPEPVRMPGRGAPFHRPLALPGRMMRVLGPVVQTLRLPVFHRGHHHAVGGPVAGELVGDEHPRYVPQSLEQSAEELLGGHRNGTIHYLWRAVDQHGNVLDVLVQSRRHAVAAQTFFRRLLTGLR